MAFIPALPRRITRPASVLIVLAWFASMAVVINRSYLQASSANLATDLARYGSEAVWRGVYYRGEKVGFTVSQTVPAGDGFEIQEDGRLQMTLLGATTPAVLRTVARVDRDFSLRSFDFSLDPGTGPVRVRGTVEPSGLSLSISSASGTRRERIELEETPALTLNLARRLASGGLVPGARHQWMLFDPATLRNAPVTVRVAGRELVRGSLAPVPAFRVEMEFGGLRTTSWMTDTGEVVREESPLGLMTIRETPEQARSLQVPLGVRGDLLRAAAVVPVARERIDDTLDVRGIRLRVDGMNLSDPDLQGAGQTVSGDIVEIRDFRTLVAGPRDPDLARYLVPETLIESDAPEIKDEALRAVRGAVDPRSRAERLTRYINGLLEKKPTVSLPSAREVLRTRVGDCNEHTALYVAMARSIGIPARIAVGLVYMHGAFYYHAWPEAYVNEGLWLPVDPTLNQFPADTTHLRLARGGLDRQASILPALGRLAITIERLDLVPTARRILIGREARDIRPLEREPAAVSWRRCR